MLLLFDIDGTLLQSAAKAHGAALNHAMTEVFGVEDPGRAGIDAAGRTDLEIARATLVALGVSARRIDEGLDDLRDACCAEYARSCPQSLADHVVPGMGDLLNGLAAREDLLLALVTGNLEPIARLKLARAGIGKRFVAGVGGFGSDSEDRAELPGIARRRAGRHLHAAGAGSAGSAGSAAAPYPRSRTLIIGDTPRDIACARADGVACVAVCTGPYAAEQLTGADAVARDTGELRRLIEERIDGRGHA